jgi:hypothetical protein
MTKSITIYEAILECRVKRRVKHCKECMRYKDGPGFVNAECPYHVGTAKMEDLENLVEVETR